MLLVFRFEPFILRLYCCSTLQAITLSISLKLFNGLDYFVSGLRPIRAYESFSEVLWHLPPQLVVEVVFFYRCQEWVFKAFQMSVEVNYQPSLQIPFGFLVAVISLRYACFFWPEYIVHGVNECLPCDVFQLFGIALQHPVLVGLGIWLQHSAYVVYAFLVRIEHVWECLVIILQWLDLLPKLLCVLPSVLKCVFIESWPISAGLGRGKAWRSHLVDNSVVLFL